ncbi:MAG: hypothetical protein LBN99_00950 [Oscillospiraceae bacterium]|nr:hypothetical protein [Oscillospiraceae bacterium]
MSNDRLSHAYIVRGGDAASPFTRELIAKMLGETHRDKVFRGIHPDVTVVTFEINKNTGKLRTEIIVDQIRDAVFASSVAPNEAEFSVIVVENAHAMNINAQNALLKTLEEPPRHVKLILVTSEPGALLPTVRSRCVLVDSGETGDAVPERIRELAERYLDALARGDTALCEFSFELDDTDKADFALFLPEARRLAAALLRKYAETGASPVPPRTLSRIAELTREAETYLEQNVNVTHIAALVCTLD